MDRIKKILKHSTTKKYEVCENHNLRVSNLSVTQDVFEKLQEYLEHECLAITFDKGVMVIHN